MKDDAWNERWAQTPVAVNPGRTLIDVPNDPEEATRTTAPCMFRGHCRPSALWFVDGTCLNEGADE